MELSTPTPPSSLSTRSGFASTTPPTTPTTSSSSSSTSFSSSTSTTTTTSLIVILLLLTLLLTSFSSYSSSPSSSSYSWSLKRDRVDFEQDDLDDCLSFIEYQEKLAVPSSDSPSPSPSLPSSPLPSVTPSLANLTGYCGYLLDDSECDDESNLNLPYMWLYYCQGFPPAASVTVAVVMLLCFFYLLTHIADSYFSPVLELLAEKLKMSEEVAGITFLALGNGAPDVASTFASVRQGNWNFAIGGLMASSLFITCCIVSIISFISDTTVSRGPFFRDTGFLLVAVCGILVVCWDGAIYIYEAMGFVVAYLAYTAIGVTVHYVKARRTGPQRMASFSRGGRDQVADSLLGDDGLPQTEGFNTVDLSSNLMRTDPNFILDSDSSGSDDIEQGRDSRVNARGMSPKGRGKSGESGEVEWLEGDPVKAEPEEPHWSFAEWRRKFKKKALWKKILYIATFPLSILCVLTVPFVKWNRFQASLLPIFVPFLYIIQFELLETTVFVDSFPVLLFAPLCGIPVSLLIWFTSKYEEAPRYYPVFPFVAMVNSVIWMNLVAEELTQLMTSLGLVLNVSNIILGTILAWGNSLGDLAANIALARNGSPRMALAGSYAGPTFNVLFGLGLSLTVETAREFPVPYPVSSTVLYWLTSFFLVFVVTVSIVVIAGFQHLRVTRRTGVLLLVLYGAYTIVTLLLEFHVIPFPHHIL
eukprot:TRINITY_DN1960_c0_g1_i1.p1 TRINITY_DN1960_c0_g1~~TRINITY_DN1960_c0_g1_i1.p1  ORF type:complete len:735 (-),score=179.99 TRINITY_DN1960_c0_g1_i1:154-2253(-)